MTIENSRIPSGGVVVIGSISRATQERLVSAADGKIEKVSDTPLTQIIEKPGVDLRRFSERISKVVGTEGVVAPLLADDEGNKLLPTGRMQVRFKEPPTERFLASFAKRHNIELAQRNKWSPQQVEFAVRSDDKRYFPDVAAELKEDGEVVTAWPDVQATFRRERG